MAVIKRDIIEAFSTWETRLIKTGFPRSGNFPYFLRDFFDDQLDELLVFNGR